MSNTLSEFDGSISDFCNNLLMVNRMLSERKQVYWKYGNKNSG